MLGGGVALAAAAVGGRTFLESRDLADRRAADRAALAATPALTDLLRFATLAANGHNTQPWRFVAGGGGVSILPDATRQTPVADPDGHHLYASLGAAAENLFLAARARGLGGELAVRPDGTIQSDLTPGKAEVDALFDAIPLRQTTRSLFDGAALPPEQADRLLSAARAAGAEALWIADADRIAAVTELILAANMAQLHSRSFLDELKSWIRFSRAAAMRTGDGLYSAATGAPVLPDLIGPLAFDFALDPEAENERYAVQIASSAGLLVIVAPSDTPAGWVASGRACQRVMLQATADDLRCAFVNQPVELPNFRAELAALLDLGDRRPSLILRLGRAEAMPYSLRRPVSEVLSY